MVKIFLGEFIGNEYQDWEGRDDVFIETPTGSGKTTLVAGDLPRYAMKKGKEVLLLVNRKILKNQIKSELAKEHGMKSVSDEELTNIKEFGGITILSYQELQEELKREPLLLGRFYSDRYSYIVFDECHYLLQDATFNREIEFLIRAIPKRRNATKIFLSATMDEVRPFLLNMLYSNEMEWWYIRDSKEKQILAYQRDIFTCGRIFYYSIEPKFRIQSLQYFRELSELSEVINKDESGEKWLIFVNSKKEAGILKKSLEKSFSYLDAEVDEDDPVKQQIVTESKFDTDVLITTKVLDNGVNLIDEKLKNIALLTTEKTEFLQMLGRKRFKEDEKGVKVYITRRSAGYFNALRNIGIKSDQKFMEAIEENPKLEQRRFDDLDFVKFCQRMVILEGGRLTISKAAKEKLRLQAKFYDLMIQALQKDPEAFIKEQVSWVGETFDPSRYLKSSEEKMQKIVRFMESVSGKEMDKSEQEKFRNRLSELASEYGEKLTDREDRLVGKAKINKFCKKHGLPYVIEAIKNSKFWIIKGEGNNEEEELHN